MKKKKLKKQIENLKESELGSNYQLDDDISELDIISRITRALKMIEILGQLTKKHWAEIKGPKKLELAGRNYLLGL